MKNKQNFSFLFEGLKLLLNYLTTKMYNLKVIQKDIPEKPPKIEVCIVILDVWIVILVAMVIVAMASRLFSLGATMFHYFFISNSVGSLSSTVCSKFSTYLFNFTLLDSNVLILSNNSSFDASDISDARDSWFRPGTWIKK